MGNNKAYHWTDESGINNIFCSAEIEPGSFSRSLDLPFDIDNCLSFGIVMDMATIEEAGGKPLPPDTTGVTALELEFELRTEKAISIFEIDSFVVRSAFNNQRLLAILENYGFDQTSIEIVAMPKYKTFDKVCVSLRGEQNG